MNNIELEEITLIGLSLGATTTNANGQSGKDCGVLWQKFEKDNYAESIPQKLTNEIVAVYHKYEGDFTRPFSYFIGMKVTRHQSSAWLRKDDYSKSVVSKNYFKRERCLIASLTHGKTYGIPQYQEHTTRTLKSMMSEARLE